MVMGLGRNAQPPGALRLPTQALDSPALVDHDAIMSVRPGKPLSQVCVRVSLCRAPPPPFPAVVE